MGNVCLVNKAAARREIQRTGSKKEVALITEVLQECSSEVEAELDRRVISRGTITEYHDASRDPGSVLQLSEFPIIAISTVHEDSSRGYAAATLLTLGTHYLVDTEAAQLIRISGGSPANWSTSFEAIRIVWTAGYATPDDVPGEIKAVTKQYFARRYREVVEQEIGKTNVSDGFGSRTHMPAELSDHQRRRLAGLRNAGSETLVRSSVAA